VGFFDWLLGKTARTTSPSHPVPPDSAPPGATRPVPQETPAGSGPAPSVNGVDRREPAAPRQEERLPGNSPERPVAPARTELSPSRTDNLRRWREAGQARVWVEAHNGTWDHADWLALLDELQRSPFWPLEPDDVGRTLEEERAKWSDGR
jgi:hypothetical protein